MRWSEALQQSAHSSKSVTQYCRKLRRKWKRGQGQNHRSIRQEDGSGMIAEDARGTLLHTSFSPSILWKYCKMRWCRALHKIIWLLFHLWCRTAGHYKWRPLLGRNFKCTDWYSKLVNSKFSTVIIPFSYIRVLNRLQPMPGRSRTLT